MSDEDPKRRPEIYKEPARQNYDRARRGVYKEMVPWHGTVMYKIVDSNGDLLARVEMLTRVQPYFPRHTLGIVLDSADPV